MTRVFCLIALLTSLLSNSVLRAEEVCCPAEDAGPAILSKIPYLNRLFKNVAPSGDCDASGACPALTYTPPRPVPGDVFTVAPTMHRHVGDDGLERIGVDFEFNGPCAAGRCATAACAAPGAPAIAMFGPPPPLAAHHPMLAQIEILSEQNRQLIEALVEARVEKATLETKLDFAEERQTLVVENALLKAQAAAPVTVATDDSEAALLREENAALKAKLASLEERLASLEQPVKKTAAKASTKRKR